MTQPHDPISALPTEVSLDGEDVILLVLEAHERLHGSRVFRGVTRLEKILYLLEKESDFEGIATFFTFEAYHYGPFSKDVYEDLDFLENCELIGSREKQFSYYAEVAETRLAEEEGSGEQQPVNAVERQYHLTEKGRKIAQMWRTHIMIRRPQDVEAMDRIVGQMGAMPLVQLIRYVYRRYPESAKRSVHPEAQGLGGE